MYVAKKKLKLESGEWAEIGQPIDVSGWPITALKAHLNLGWVEEVEEDDSSASLISDAKSKSQKKRLKIQKGG